MSTDNLESMAMLDYHDGENFRGLRVKSRKRLDRYAIAACVLVSVMLIILLGFLFSFRSTMSTVQRLLALTAPSQLLSGTSLNQVANRTLGFEEILVINLPERTDHRDGLILASAVSDIDVTFVDGVHVEAIPSKALPPGYNDVPKGAIGAWRAHMNVIDQVVKRGLSSALIMEDDVDWDVRLKEILREYALSSRALLKAAPGSTIAFESLSPNRVTNPMTSPYGDDWDVLWLGHCGSDLKAGDSRVIHANDVTVPETQYLHSYDSEATTPLVIYPNHTRVAMPLSEGVCSLAYAVSQKGARAILNSVGLKRLDNAYDIMLREFCTGIGQEKPHNCLGVLPQIFDHHRAIGTDKADSDINEAPDDQVRDKAFTLNIRWSVRMNMERILRGETDFEDQFPDVS